MLALSVGSLLYAVVKSLMKMFVVPWQTKATSQKTKIMQREMKRSNIGKSN
jgi:hypothetical protein